MPGGFDHVIGMKGAFSLKTHRTRPFKLFLNHLFHHFQIFASTTDDRLLG